MSCGAGSHSSSQFEEAQQELKKILSAPVKVGKKCSSQIQQVVSGMLQRDHIRSVHRIPGHLFRCSRAISQVAQKYPLLLFIVNQSSCRREIVGMV